ncbi:MAG: hypothetical protein HYR56_16370, partial [Acidobacteria bacterium]|nr:hypothetical protein [Acidobacteriota bacterium]
MKTTHSPLGVTRKLFSRTGKFALLALLCLTAIGLFVVLAADQFFAGDGSALTAAKWGTTAGGPFTSAFTSGNVANFATVNGTGTGGSITVGGITATENFTLTAISGTITNLSNGVIPINVSAGKTLDFSTQAFTTSATAGYNFTGPGVLALGGGTYGGGFTINSGTLVARGVNAMGGNATPGGLTINGGTIAGSANRDFSGKYSGITVGGNFQLGELVTNVASSSSAANLTFNTNMALGAATRTVTIGANGTYTLGGIISGNAGVGLTVANGSGATGTLVLSGANTYSGNTTIGSGKLALSGTGSIANSPTIEIAGGATFDVTGLTTALTLASGQALKASGTATTGTITTSATKGLTTAANSPLQFTGFNGTTAPLTISGAGSVTLASGNVVTVTVANSGTPLSAGNYVLLAKGAGSVAGTVPTSLTVNGDGIASGATASLQITGQQLVLQVVAPTVTVVGGPLTFANTAVGATSAEQTYTVAGSNLTADITVTAPSTDFQVSKMTGTGFGSAVTFMQVGGSVATQTVFVRFTPQSAGAKSGNVTNASTGATTQNVAVSGTGVACPTSFTVNDTGDAADATPGDGLCATSGSVCTLRAAIMEANAITACAPLTISFSVTGTINLTSNQLPAIDHPNLTISGPGASQLDVHRNDSLPFRIFTINSGKTVAISGLTISNGNSTPQDGGGIFNQGTLSLTDCVLSNNTNASGKGGGVASTGPLTVTRCAFTGNSANIGGGGIAQTGSTLSVTDSTLNTNTASTGGGVYMVGGTHTLTNCTVSGNTATSNGGGVGMFGNSSQPGTATLLNCTLTGNTSINGAGVFTSSTDATVIETRLKNTLVAANNGRNFDTTFIGGATNTSLGNNLDSDGTSHFTNGVNGDIVGTLGSPINALLAALGNYGGTTNTHALLPGSPAINAGTSSGAPTNDQRGSARFGATDIGAFESQGFTLAVTSGNNQSTTVNTAFGSLLSLTVAALSAGEPVNGGQVTFMPPGAGASASIAGNPATISGGAASSGTVTANGTAGGPYNVAASATGAASVNFALTNTPTAPMFTSVATLSRQQGTAASNSQVATVSDANAGTLTVTATTVPTGIIVSTIVNNSGTVTANVAALCNATVGMNTVVLTVTNATTGLMNTANLTVNVTANTPPTLGNYPNAAVTASANTTVTPNAAPADNGSIMGITAAAAGSMQSPFTGVLTVNPATGVVTITDAKPAGTYTVTVTALDNCGTSSTKTFTLTVTNPSACATPGFTGTTNVSVGSQPLSVAVGDFN